MRANALRRFQIEFLRFNNFYAVKHAIKNFFARHRILLRSAAQEEEKGYENCK